MVKGKEKARDNISYLCDKIPLIREAKCHLVTQTMNHEDVWNALDVLAHRKGMSASALAKAAGLDATAFNRSKRVNSNGKLRWPSTESIAKVLDATDSNFQEFALLVEQGLSSVSGPLGRPQKILRSIPVISMAQAKETGYFDDSGCPTGNEWDEISFPDVGDEKAYALEVIGDAMSPVYRDGDVIVVSPNGAVRRGDRVMVMTKEGDVLVQQLVRLTANRIELNGFHPDHQSRDLDTEEISWIARIVWASQ